MNSLDPTLIQNRLKDTIFRAVYCFPEVNSTNTQLMLAARHGEPEGTVYIAERQTAGRGRFRRPWEAPAGKALLVSFLLYPDCVDDRLGLVPMMAALAAAEGSGAILEQAAPQRQAAIKWPNDILIDGRKLGGVLAERERVQGGRRTALVVGVGLNVNQTVEELPERPQIPATSLMIETGKTISRSNLLVEVLRRFAKYYDHWGADDHDVLIDRISRSMTTLGQPVALQHNGIRVEGTATGLSPRGGLLVRLPAGVEREFLATDVETLDWKQ